MINCSVPAISRAFFFSHGQSKFKYTARVPRLAGLNSKPGDKKLQAKKLQAKEGLLRTSPRLKLLGNNNKHESPPRKRKAFNWDNATGEEITERVLCDYNKEHGTKLEFVGLLAGRDKCFLGSGYSIHFLKSHCFWRHLNFEARRVDADPSDKPLVLFAELMKQQGRKFHLITMSIVKPTDESNGCIRCLTCVSHPRHGFHAGLNPSGAAGEPKILSEQAAAELSESVIQGYNKKHGTTIKFERALKCNSFICSGLSMGFNEKNTNWVHMNFEVRVREGRYERVVCLFAEFYLGDDGEYVLATLSPAGAGEWHAGVNGCVFCPADILHPWRAYRFAFDQIPMESQN